MAHQFKDGRCLFTDGSMPPFYVGQKVVGSKDAPIGSRIVEGVEYIIDEVHYSYCKGRYYWYVGVIGSHKWLWPGLFSLIQEQFISITLEKILENETSLVGAN